MPVAISCYNGCLRTRLKKGSDILKPDPFNWVSIPAVDLDRAVAFYNAVFELNLQKFQMMGDEIASF